MTPAITAPPGGDAPAAAPAVAPDGQLDRAVHGIFVGCVVSTPFWLAVLALTLRP